MSSVKLKSYRTLISILCLSYSQEQLFQSYCKIYSKNCIWIYILKIIYKLLIIIGEEVTIRNMNRNKRIANIKANIMLAHLALKKCKILLLIYYYYIFYWYWWRWYFIVISFKLDLESHFSRYWGILDTHIIGLFRLSAKTWKTTKWRPWRNN